MRPRGPPRIGQSFDWAAGEAMGLVIGREETMKRYATIVMAVLAILFAADIGVPGEADAFLLRLAAHFRSFTGETVTTAAAGGALGGIAIYSTSVFAPASGVLYVTMSVAADQHFGRGAAFTCLVDGFFCNAGGGPAGGAPVGWIALQRIPAAPTSVVTNCSQGGGGGGDCHDNGIYYTWCRRVGAGTHSVSLRMGGLPPGTGAVFMEKGHFFVDFSSSLLGSPATCVTGAPAPASPEAGHGHD